MADRVDPRPSSWSIGPWTENGAEPGSGSDVDKDKIFTVDRWFAGRSAMPDDVADGPAPGLADETALRLARAWAAAAPPRGRPEKPPRGRPGAGPTPNRDRGRRRPRPPPAPTPPAAAPPLKAPSAPAVPAPSVPVLTAVPMPAPELVPVSK